MNYFRAYDIDELRPYDYPTRNAYSVARAIKRGGSIAKRTPRELAELILAHCKMHELDGEAPMVWDIAMILTKTSGGLKALIEELDRLIPERRHRAAAPPDTSLQLPLFPEETR